jgi:3-oxoacyl-[acyl-carrier protein] reductase
MRLEGKVAVITGSTRGIGEECAYEFAREGASVIVTGRNAERGEKVADTIRTNGGRALFVPTDVSNEDSVWETMERARREFGNVTVLVNNAAATDSMAEATGPLTEFSTQQFDYMLKVSLYGTFWCAKHAIPQMIEAGGGSIINMSSMASTRGFPFVPAYSAAKGGMNALTRQIAAEYGKQHVRANTIVVGVIINELTEGVIATPELEAALRNLLLVDTIGYCTDIAKLALYFAADESRYVTAQEIHVDGGSTMKGPLAGEQVQMGVQNRDTVQPDQWARVTPGG